MWKLKFNLKIKLNEYSSSGSSIIRLSSSLSSHFSVRRTSTPSWWWENNCRLLATLNPLDSIRDEKLFCFSICYFFFHHFWISRFSLEKTLEQTTKKKEEKKRLHKVVNQTFPISNFMCLSHSVVLRPSRSTRVAALISIYRLTEWMF